MHEFPYYIPSTHTNTKTEANVYTLVWRLGIQERMWEMQGPSDNRYQENGNKAVLRITGPSPTDTLASLMFVVFKGGSTTNIWWKEACVLPSTRCCSEWTLPTMHHLALKHQRCQVWEACSRTLRSKCAHEGGWKRGVGVKTNNNINKSP